MGFFAEIYDRELKRTFDAYPKLTARHVASSINEIRKDFQSKVDSSSSIRLTNKQGKKDKSVNIKYTIYTPSQAREIARRINRNKKTKTKVLKADRPSNYSLYMSVNKTYGDFQEKRRYRSSKGILMPLPARFILTPQGKIKKKYQGRTRSRIKDFDDVKYIKKFRSRVGKPAGYLIDNETGKVVINLFDTLIYPKLLKFFESFNKQGYNSILKKGIDNIVRDMNRGLKR